VARVIKRLTGIALPSTSTWRLLHQRLGWTVQWPERKAKEAEVTPGIGCRRFGPAASCARGVPGRRLASLVHRAGYADLRGRQ
jgi:hypothetical protein